MKIPAVFLILSLANCCFFFGTDASGRKVDCSRYPQPPIGDCPRESRPVCGTDGMTYDHVCILCARIWATGVQIGIRHKGECRSQD